MNLGRVGETVRVINQVSRFYGKVGVVTQRGKGWWVKFPDIKDPVYIPFGVERCSTTDSLES